MNLIVGGDGTIGRALSAYWQCCGVPYKATTRHQECVDAQHPYIDLSTCDWSGLDEVQYGSVVFCAAVTKLLECEDDPKHSRFINTVATVDLAQLLSVRSDFMLLLSTNQVFDGSKPNRVATDSVCPVNEYGRQKADAEKRFLQISNAGILRLSKVVYPDLPLLKNWEKSLLRGENIEVFEDMYLAPMWLDDVVAKIDLMCKKRERGVVHLGSDGDLSYYDFVLSYFKGIPQVGRLIKKVKMPRYIGESSLYPRFSSMK